MKVLLIQPIYCSLLVLDDIFKNRNFTDFSVKRINFPLGLLHIGSCLDSQNVETKIIDLARHLYYYINDDSNGNKSLQGFLDRYLIENIREYKPDIVGISGNFNTNATFIEKCCEEIKRVDKNIVTVLGGHFFTNSYEKALKAENGADYIILGEGEEVMMDIVRAVKTNRDALDTHPHVVTRKNVLKGSMDGKNPGIVWDLESLPPMNYFLLEDFSDYLTSKHDMHTIVKRGIPTKAVALMTSRGCPHCCTYCASHKVHGRKMRAFSVDRVLDEISDLVEKYDVNTLAFEDDLFTYSRKRTIEFCQKICDRFGNRFLFDFPNGIAVYTLNEEVVYWLAKAGMKQINLAVESGNQYVQNEVIKKRIKLEKVKPVVDLLKKHNVLVRAYFIVGFPGETIDMMRDTKNFAKQLELDWSVFSFATPIVGSELYESARRNGNLISQDMDTSTYSDFKLRSDEWGPKDVVEIQQEANYEVNFLGNHNLVKEDYAKSKLIFEDIVRDYPKHLLANYCFWKALMGLGEIKKSSIIEKRIATLIREDESNLKLIKKYNLIDQSPFANLSIMAGR